MFVTDAAARTEGGIPGDVDEPIPRRLLTSLIETGAAQPM